jgi:hypothetical protein
MESLEASGGYLVLDSYRGPDIPKLEWESLTYLTEGVDPKTFFAPITSATGKLELEPFWYGKPDLDRVWAENASRCPTIVSWIESIGARFGRVQLLRMSPTRSATVAFACIWIPTTEATRSPTAGSCACGWS